MITNQPVKNNSFQYFLIGALSIIIPCLVAILYFIPGIGNFLGIDTKIFPHINAVLNSATAIALVTGYVFIRKGNRKGHIISMITAFGLSTLFLVFYVLYHSTVGHTLFGDVDGNGVVSEIERTQVGGLKLLYSIILISHIILAAIIVPFVLLSIYLGWAKQYNTHRKVSKWTLPLWLYVAISGVIVYFMISPYYQ